MGPSRIGLSQNVPMGAELVQEHELVGGAAFQGLGCVWSRCQPQLRSTLPGVEAGQAGLS